MIIQTAFKIQITTTIRHANMTPVICSGNANALKNKSMMTYGICTQTYLLKTNTCFTLRRAPQTKNE